MPDQSSAANEHAIFEEITGPLATLPDDPVPIAAEVDFPVVLRGYDRLAVDAYVKKTTQLIAELQATRSPEAAVRRALERVGEQISGILQRAHDTAEEITVQSRREAEDRLEQVRREAAQITANAEARLKDLDGDIDRIWGERQRIIDDVRDLSRELTEVSQAAATRFPPAEEPTGPVTAQGPEGLALGDEPEATAVLPTVGADEPAVEEAPGFAEPVVEDLPEGEWPPGGGEAPEGERAPEGAEPSVPGEPPAPTGHRFRAEKPPAADDATGAQSPTPGEQPAPGEPSVPGEARAVGDPSAAGDPPAADDAHEDTPRTEDEPHSP